MTLHAAVANPHIDFDASPFVLNRELKPWPAPCIDGRERPRIAGISSFGAGGSNAHLLIEEFAAPPAPAVAGPVLLPLSARTARQLQRKAADLAAFLARHEGEPDLAAIAYTLQVGREAMDHRLALVADSAAALRQQLDAWPGSITYYRLETGECSTLPGKPPRQRQYIAALTAVLNDLAQRTLPA